MNLSSGSINFPVIVIDIGGTSFRSCVYLEGNKLAQKAVKIPTPNFINHSELKIDKLQKLLINLICETVGNYIRANPILNTVGISFPAPITSSGTAVQAPTIWGESGKNLPLTQILKKRLPKVNLVIANDITAAAERYANLPKYQKYEYITVITISSGIGNKIYDQKKRAVLLDKNGRGGEMGHIRVDFSPSAPVCDCGGIGHLGALSSGRAIERTAIREAKKNPKSFKNSFLSKYVKQPTDITNEILVKTIKRLDPFSLEILDQATFPLAVAISNITGNLGADKFILVGGFALACGNVYLASLKRNFKKVDFFGYSKQAISSLASLGINDGSDCMIGIGQIAQKLYAKKTN